MKRTFKYSSASYEKLSENEKHTLAMRHALNVYPSNAIYSYIPKNGCSTMRLSLAIENGCISETNQIEWIHKNNETFSANLKDLAMADYTFVVLRCPYKRLASAFLDKFSIRAKGAWDMNKASKVIKRVKNDFGGFFDTITNKSIRIDEISFSSFVKELKKDRFRDLNIHWRPQTDFLVYENYDDYFSIEEFDVAKATLEKKIGFEIYDARKLTNHGIDGLEKISVDNIMDYTASEIKELRAQGKTPIPKTLYNDELIGIVKDVFNEDLRFYEERFGSKNLMFQ